MASEVTICLASYVCNSAGDAERLVEDVICIECDPSKCRAEVVTKVGVIMTNSFDIAGHLHLLEHGESPCDATISALGVDKVTPLVYRYNDSGSVAVNLTVVTEGGVC